MKTNIKQLRILRGYTQAQLAALVDVSESAISQYESGKKIPSTETLYKLGEALDCPVSDILDDRKSVEFSLSTLEREFIRKYRSLDKHGRNVVDFVLNAEYQRCAAEPEPEAEQKTKIIPLFAAAAGPGEPVDGEPLDEYEVDAKSPAQFAVKISGDSMEPELHDGEIVLCKRKRPQTGELAVINVNGFMLVKQYIEDGFGNIYLRSINRARKALDVDLWASGNDTAVGYGTVIHRKLELVRE